MYRGPKPELVKLARTVAPLPFVSLAEAKVQCRVDHSDDDARLAAIVAAACAMIDGPTQRAGAALAPQRWRYHVAGPSSDGKLWLDVAPARALHALAYYNPAGTLVNANLAEWSLQSDEESWAYVVPVSGAWPALANRWDALQVEWEAGQANVALVPPELSQAALLLARHWYDNTSAVIAGSISKEIEFGVETLINTARRGWVGA
jgi:uncharacterized phiE125 gp8 family phage protein